MVPDEPPAPAERVELGRAFRSDSLWSAAARRRMAARGPPGGVGEEGRPTEEPEAAAPEPAPEDLVSGPDSAPEVRGEAGRGEACFEDVSMELGLGDGMGGKVVWVRCHLIAGWAVAIEVSIGRLELQAYHCDY